MEALNNKLGGDLAKIGLCAIASIGILANRLIVRPRVNSTSYDKVSLQAEHLLFHAAFAMGVDGFFDILNMLNGIPYSISWTYFATAASWLEGVLTDLRKRQVGQFISDTVGCFAYLLPAVVLTH